MLKDSAMSLSVRACQLLRGRLKEETTALIDQVAVIPTVDKVKRLGEFTPDTVLVRDA